MRRRPYLFQLVADTRTGSVGRIIQVMLQFSEGILTAGRFLRHVVWRGALVAENCGLQASYPYPGTLG